MKSLRSAHADEADEGATPPSVPTAALEDALPWLDDVPDRRDEVGLATTGLPVGGAKAIQVLVAPASVNSDEAVKDVPSNCS